MRNIENRIAELEEKLNPRGHKVFLLVSYDTTIEEAKADYEKQVGYAVTLEEFKQRLPDVGFVHFIIVDDIGPRSNQWVDEFIASCKSRR